MSALLEEVSETLADVLKRLGDVPLNRILMKPAPGTATPRDALLLSEREPKRLCELVDGVLVEKAMGHQSSRLAGFLLYLLWDYLQKHDLGTLSGANGPHQLSEEQVRFPDVAFIAWDRIPQGADPATPMPDWIPNLAVEILSPGNTRGEMRRKLADHFAAGVELVWIADPHTRTVAVYTSPTEFQTRTDTDTLDGGTVLPGFTVPLAKWFAQGTRLR